MVRLITPLRYTDKFIGENDRPRRSKPGLLLKFISSSSTLITTIAPPVGWRAMGYRPGDIRSAYTIMSLYLIKDVRVNNAIFFIILCKLII